MLTGHIMEDMAVVVLKKIIKNIYTLNEQGEKKQIIQTHCNEKNPN